MVFGIKGTAGSALICSKPIPESIGTSCAPGCPKSIPVLLGRRLVEIIEAAGHIGKLTEVGCNALKAKGSESINGGLYFLLIDSETMVFSTLADAVKAGNVGAVSSTKMAGLTGVSKRTGLVKQSCSNTERVFG